MWRSDLTQTAPQNGKILVTVKKFVSLEKVSTVSESTDNVTMHTREGVERIQHHCKAVDEQLRQVTSSVAENQA